MTAIRKHPSEADLWHRYTHLPAGSKQVLRLKSLVFLSTNKTALGVSKTWGGWLACLGLIGVADA